MGARGSEAARVVNMIVAENQGTRLGQRGEGRGGETGLERGEKKPMSSFAEKNMWKGVLILGENREKTIIEVKEGTGCGGYPMVCEQKSLAFL